MKCNLCGYDLIEGNNNCPNCGAVVVVPSTTKPNDNKYYVLLGIIIFVVALGSIFGFMIGRSVTPPSNNQVTTINSNQGSTNNVFDDDDKQVEAVEIDASQVVFKEEENNERTKNLEGIAMTYLPKGDSRYRDLGLLFKNNNNEMVDVTAYVNFYKNGQRIGSEQGTQYSIRSNSRFIINMQIDFFEKYDSYDVSYRASKSKSLYTEIPVDDTKITVNKMLLHGDKYNYDVTFLNNSDKDGVFYGGLIYYSGDKIVAIKSSISEAPTNTVAKFTFYDSALNGIKYDKVEPLVFSSYYRGTDY